MAKQKYNPLLKIGFQEVSTGGGGGGGDLQSTLIAGNITGGNSIIFSTGATIKPSAGNFCIDPQFFGTPDLSVISNITTTDTVGVFTITGTGGSIDTLTVNGNPLIGSAVPFNGNISQTALDLINQMIGDAGGLGITYPRPPRIVSVDFNSNTAKILVVLDGTYNTNVLASTTTTLVFAQVQPMTLQNIYDGSLFIDSSNNKKIAGLLVNPFESFGYQQEDSDIIRIGVTDSGGPQSFASIVPSGVFIYNETNITDLTTDIPGLVGLGLVSTAVDRIVNNTTSTGLIAICLNSGNNTDPSNINQGVVGAVLLSGIGLTAKTNHTPYTNQISFQESGNTFDGMLKVGTNTADRAYTLPDRSGIVHVEDPNIVHVFSASDLPAALVTDTTYIIHGTITTANTILVANQNTAIVGLNRDRDRLIYTGNTSFINILDADFFIDNICFEATDPASLVIDARNYTAASFNEGRTKVLHITNCQFRNCYNVCDFEGFDLIDIENTLFWYIKAPTIGVRYLNTSKIEITSCEFIRWFDETTIPTPGGWSTAAMFEILPNGVGVGVGAVNITSSLFHPQQTQIGVKVDPTSTTGFGTISSNTFINVGLTTGTVFSPIAFGLPDYSQTATQTFDVFANQGVLNSTSGVVNTLVNNVTDTVIAAANTPVIINTGGSATLQAAVRYTVATGGRSTYTGSKQVYVSLHASISYEKQGGGTDTYNFFFYKNGALLPGSLTSTAASGALADGAISMVYGTLMNQNDYIEIYVENDGGTNDILIKDYQLVIRE